MVWDFWLDPFWELLGFVGSFLTDPEVFEPGWGRRGGVGSQDSSGFFKDSKRCDSKLQEL